MFINYKKTITLLSIISLGFISLSFAKSINYEGKSFEVIEDTYVNGETVNLLNKRIAIPNGENKEFGQNRYDIKLSGNLNKTSPITGSSITFNCSGGSVYATGEDTFQVGGKEFMYLQLADSNNKYQLQVSCSPKEEEKSSSPKDSLPFNEKSVKGKGFSNFSISSSNTGFIKENDITTRLEKTNPKGQPTFTDILYLQIKTIGNLNDSLQSLGIENLSSVFSTDNDYQDYLKWNNKFNNFSDKQSFIEAKSGAIVLKDIGIGADMIKGLSKRLKCEIEGNISCDDEVSIQKNYNDRYDFYSIKEISNTIYNDGQSGIGNNFIGLYSGLQNIDTSSLSGEQQEMVESFLDDMFSDSVDSMENYELGFGLDVRKQNLQTLSNYFEDTRNTEDDVNLLSIYNFFYEINNVVKGTENLSKLKTSVSSGSDSVNNFFMNELPKVIIQEKKDLHGNEFTGDTTVKEIENKLYENFSGNYSDYYFSGLVYKGNCFDYNTGNMTTKKDKWNIIEGVSSKASTINKTDSYVELEINLENLIGTSYNTYIKGNGTCNDVPSTDQTITGSITTEEVFTGNLYNTLDNLDNKNSVELRVSSGNSNDNFTLDDNGDFSYDSSEANNTIFEIKARDKYDTQSTISIDIEVIEANNLELVAEANYDSAGNLDMNNENIEKSQKSVTNNSYSITDLESFNSDNILDKESSFVEIGGKKGIFIDNNGFDDYLKYNIGDLNLDEADKFAIEVSVRGAALKRDDSSAYYLLHSESPELKFRIHEGKLKLDVNDEEKDWDFNKDDISDDKFYTVRLEYSNNDDEFTMKIKGDRVNLAEKSDFGISSSLSDLYVGNKFEPARGGIGSNNYESQRNDIINFVKIYK